MKLLDLDAIRARCDAATPGPWTYDDGDFVAHARTDIPALLAYVHDLEQELAENDRTLNGRPEEGTWSAFATKVVEERDRLRGVCDLRLRIMERLKKERDEALADAGCVVPIELDRTIEHAIRTLAELALTAEERIEQMARERYEARAQLAATDTDTGSPCDGHRHCCADRRRLAEELLRVRAERDALKEKL